MKTDAELLAEFEKRSEAETDILQEKVPEDPRPALERMFATKELAEKEFPEESWVETLGGIELGSNIRAAETRTPRSKNQKDDLKKELKQARFLADEGRTVYFLPEIGEQGQKHPDAIIDGRVTELKTITGKLNQVGKEFSGARSKSDKPIDVFLYIDSKDKAITKDSVLSLLSRKITEKNMIGGRIILKIGEKGEKIWINVDSLNKNTRP